MVLSAHYGAYMMIVWTYYSVSLVIVSTHYDVSDRSLDGSVQQQWLVVEIVVPTLTARATARLKSIDRLISSWTRLRMIQRWRSSFDSFVTSSLLRRAKRSR